MATGSQGSEEDKPGSVPSDSFTRTTRDCSGLASENHEALNCALQDFLQHFKENKERDHDKGLAEKCALQAKIWYHKIVENMMGDRKRLGKDISGLPTDYFFHLRLVACCLGISISSNHLPFDFPLLLQVLKLAPYSLIEVIALVLRSKLDRHHGVLKHIYQMGRQILESLAWTNNSPLWQEIHANRDRFPLIQQVMPPHLLEDSVKVDFDWDQRQDQDSLKTNLTSDYEEPHLSSATEGSLDKNGSLHTFSRMVYTMMAARLHELCAHLKLSKDLRKNTWTCFERSIVQHPSLLVNGHLDQLLLCCLHIVADVTRTRLSFSDITKVYISLPYATENICKCIPTEDSVTKDQVAVAPPTPSTPSEEEERGSFISFYRAYSVRVQQLIRQFDPAFEGDTPPSSPYPRRQKELPEKHRLGDTNIFISQLKKGSSSPSTPTYTYTFGSSPAESLCKINDIKASTPQKRRALSFPEEEGGTSAKKQHTDAQSLLQNRLKEVIKDREKVWNQFRV